MIDWYLSEVIPDDHPILFGADKIDGDTALMLLVRKGLLYLAERLLSKVTDKAVKLQLMETENTEKQSIETYAKQQGVPRIIKWIKDQKCVEFDD